MWRPKLVSLIVLGLLGTQIFLRNWPNNVKSSQELSFDDFHGEKNLWITGFHCENGHHGDVNQEYAFEGLTLDGRPYYRGLAQPARFLYYDLACAADTPGGRWFLGGEPDVNFEHNLNQHDGEGCENEFSIITDSMTVPVGQQPVDWQWCGDHGYADKRHKVYIVNVSMVARSGSAKEQDCYFDKDCHKLVDWDKVTLIKERLFAHLKEQGSDISVEQRQGLKKRLRDGLMGAGVPRDRVDYIVDKWMKPSEKEQDCYFDKACRKLVDWDKVTLIKKKLFAHGKAQGGNISVEQQQELKKRVRDGLMAAGVPQDRVDYIVDKWMKYIVDKWMKPSEKKQDCYFDKECRKLVDWDKVSLIKERLFAHLEEHGGNISVEQLQRLKKRVRDGLMAAGVPQDRVDYIVDKWMKRSESNVGECSKFVAFRENVMQSCTACSKYYPDRVRGCMGCGKKCAQVSMCKGPAECGRNPEFVKCHKTCMRSSAIDPEDSNECSNLEAFVEDVLHGCKTCSKFYHGKVEECMECGKKCSQTHQCKGSAVCGSNPAFVKCHQNCMIAIDSRDDSNDTILVV